MFTIMLIIVTMCVISYAANVSYTVNKYGETYQEPVFGTYSNKWIFYGGNASASTTMDNLLSNSRYAWVYIERYDKFYNTISEQKSASQVVGANCLIYSGEVVRHKIYWNEIYKHKGAVYGGTTSSTPIVDQIQYNVTQEIK